MKASAQVLEPFVLAAFVAAVCLPIVAALVRRGVPRSAAVTLVMAALLLLVIAVGALVLESVNSLSEEMPKYQARLVKMGLDAEVRLAELGIDPAGLSLRELVKPGALLNLVQAAVAQAASLISNGVLVLLALAFMLVEATGLPDKLQLAFGNSLFDDRGLKRMLSEIQAYLAIKTGISLATGLLLWFWVSLVGLDFAAFWGFVAFVLNFIPNLGSIIAAIPAILLAALQLGPGAALLTTIGYLLVNFVLGNLLEPNLMGRRLGLSTLVVFFSLVFWGWAWGPWVCSSRYRSP